MKLSKLQKGILLLAAKKRMRFSPGRDILTAAEVKRDCYQFKPKRSWPRIIFSRADIGVNRYKAASVAIAKAFNRLTERGLTERVDGRGVKLTQEGAEVAANFLTLDNKVTSKQTAN